MTCASSGGSERRAIHAQVMELGRHEAPKQLCVKYRVRFRIPPWAPPARLSRELVCRAKRFDKSKRRLTAGQTALICRYGEIRLDTSNLRFDGSNTIWVRIPVAVPWFLSFCKIIQQGPFTSFLLFPALLIRCFGLYRIESNKAL